MNTTTHGQEIDIRGQVLLVLEDSSACFGDTSSSVQLLLHSLSTCTCCITVTVGRKLRAQADVSSAQQSGQVWVESYMGELKTHVDKTFGKKNTHGHYEVILLHHSPFYSIRSTCIYNYMCLCTMHRILKCICQQSYTPLMTPPDSSCCGLLDPHKGGSN